MACGFNILGFSDEPDKYHELTDEQHSADDCEAANGAAHDERPGGQCPVHLVHHDAGDGNGL